jgi:hypothetical protein
MPVPKRDKKRKTILLPMSAKIVHSCIDNGIPLFGFYVGFFKGNSKKNV